MWGLILKSLPTALLFHIMTQSWNRSSVLPCAASQPSSTLIPQGLLLQLHSLPIFGQHPALPQAFWLPDCPGFFLITPDCPLLPCGPGNLSDSGLDTLGVSQGCPTPQLHAQQPSLSALGQMQGCTPQVMKGAA